MRNNSLKIVAGAMAGLAAFMLALTFTREAPAAEKKGKKALYYRNPMNPSITSPAFMKDSMGMDYIPVYEEEEPAGPSKETVVKLKEAQQEIIGVKTEVLGKRELSRTVRTVAKIAFDPELYKAEQEFIQAYKAKEAVKSSQSAQVKERLEALFLASQTKLKLLGLADEQIKQLESKDESDRGLIISDDQTPYVWAYLTIYEYDLGAIKPGDKVTLKALAWPAEEFSGEISAIDPVLDANTRSARARCLVNNPQNKLKPNMYADAFIHIDLGEALALPKEAVLDTGLRKIVYLDLGKGSFKAQEVETGPEAQDIEGEKFFPVIRGLKENDVVVTTGNFLIDSQSQLTGGISALWGGATEIKQEPQTEHKH